MFNLLGIFDCRQFWRGAIQVPTFTGDSPEGLFNFCVWLVLVQWENFIYDICSLCWGSVISFGIYSCNSCDLIIGLDPHMGWWLGQLIMRFGLFVELLSCPPFVGTVKPEPNTISLSLHVIPMGLAFSLRLLASCRGSFLF